MLPEVYLDRMYNNTFSTWICIHILYPHTEIQKRIYKLLLAKLPELCSIIILPLAGSGGYRPQRDLPLGGIQLHASYLFTHHIPLPLPRQHHSVPVIHSIGGYQYDRADGGYVQ